LLELEAPIKVRHLPWPPSVRRAPLA
jgi:hypothetical protein